MGGDFFYAPPTHNNAANLLLIAGGVGINPLMSMLQHHVSLLPQTRFGEDHHGNSSHGAVQLLYSAKNESELIFKVCHTRGMSVLALINVICLFSACSALTLAVDVMFFCAHVRVLLQDKLDRMCGGFGQVHAQYFVTRNSKDDVSLNVQSE